MALYTYLTQACREDAQTHDMEAVVEGWREKIEQDQAIGSVDRFPRPFIKKNVGRRGRLIVEERTVGDDVVYCFLRVLIRGGSEYDAFMKDQQRFHDQHAPSDEEVRLYLQQRKQEKPVAPLPQLSNAEHIYLSSLSRSPQRQDGVVLESREWVARMNQRVRREHRIRYGDLLQELVANVERSGHTTVFQHEEDPRFRVLYRYFPRLKTWFVIAPLDPENPEDDERILCDQFRRVLSADENTARELLLQEGLRSYPALITLDTDLWLNTQESEEANLALSPEEVDVLNSVLSSESSGPGAYPLFINGRPGSGKSTVLLYLFAEHLYFHLQQVWKKGNGVEDALPFPPIYLTYSESLLNDAKRIVQDILRCDSEKALSDTSYLVNPTIQEEFNRSFGYFRHFLWSLLPQEDRSRFVLDKYVDFAVFRGLYQDRIAQFPDAELRSLSPEIAWHVIRSYIKGMRQDASGYIDLAFYESELPRDQQSVARETFRAVHDAAWTRTYKRLCEEQGYWDDQDLARHLLDLEQEGRLDLSIYPAIFCDEAQDFTKVELELILHLSRYTKRNVPAYYLHKIPFAFAGDPFQTLNPTGFDWDATQASFHDNIVKQLDKSGQADLQFNFKELAFNYRSSRPIVQFCNLIQIMRGRAFGLRSLQPQRTWQVGPASDPVYFAYDNPVCRQALRNEPGLVIIVPCQEGAEEEFVRNDDFLRSFAWDDQEQVITRDVLSPMRAKGLQFKRVVLYKFGAQALREFGTTLRCFLEGRAEELAKEEALPLEYFINGLYVAASRPRQHLMIVDTVPALKDFWSFATNPDFDALIASYTSRFDWKPENLTKILPGTDQSWSQNRDDPRQLADDFFSRGRAGRDPYLLSRAIQNYEAVGDEASAAHARALKFTFEGKLREAGRVYAGLGRVEDALQSFWQSRSYEDILVLGEQNAQLSHSIRHRAAAFMAGDQGGRSAELFIHHVFERIREGDKASLLADPLWPEILKQALHALARHADTGEAELEAYEWQRVYSEILALRQEGLRIDATVTLARAAYEARAYEDARTWWKQAGESLEAPPFWMVKVLGQVENYPNNLQWLAKAEQFEEVLTRYEQHRSIPLVANDEDIIFGAYLELGDLEGALKFVRDYATEARLIRLLDELVSREWYRLAPQAAEALVNYYVQTSEWAKATAFARQGDLIGVEPATRKRVRGFRWDLPLLDALLVRRLARSEELVHEFSRSRLTSVSDYLKERLLPAEPALRARISVQEAGAAIERANKVVDALAFYESVISGSWGADPEVIRWAQERWVKVKMRQVQLAGNKMREELWQKEAEERRRTWNVPEVDTLPEYPELDTIAALPASELPQADSAGGDGQASSPDERERPEEISSAASPQDIPVEETEPVLTGNGEAPASPSSDTPAASVAQADVETPAAGPEEDMAASSADVEIAVSEVSAPDPAPVEASPAETAPVEASPVEAAPAEREPAGPIFPEVRLEIKIGALVLSGTVNARYRVLELQESTSEAKVLIHAVQQTIQGLYGVEDVVPPDPAEERGPAWRISDWSLCCTFEQQDGTTLIRLAHEENSQTVLVLGL